MCQICWNSRAKVIQLKELYWTMDNKLENRELDNVVMLYGERPKCLVVEGQQKEI